MSIRRGEHWGRPGPLPDDGVVVDDDAALRRLVVHARETGRPVPTVGLLGGDLCRTVGGRGDRARLRSDAARTFPLDLGIAEIDGAPHPFVAHCVARRGWWRGPLVAVMNAAFLGDWNVAPRAHPGDGRLNVVEADLPLRDRVAAWRRLPTGTHVPHPAVRERRLRTAEWRFDRPLVVHLDGQRVARCRHLVVSVEPDALLVVV